MGFVLEYIFKDLSKNPGFLVKNTITKQVMVLIHIFIGIVVGLLTLPVKYNNSESTFSVQLRQSVGVLVFLAYSIRNFAKHPRNLEKNLSTCSNEYKSLDHQYSLFKSSVTRQQMQLLLGISISCILAFMVLDTSGDQISSTSVVFLVISGLFWVQIILQFVKGHTNTDKIRQDFRECMKKTTI
jgi:uncharacterized membrane protein